MVYLDKFLVLLLKLVIYGFYYLRNAVIIGLNLDDIKSNAIYVMWIRIDFFIKFLSFNYFVFLKNKD